MFSHSGPGPLFYPKAGNLSMKQSLPLVGNRAGRHRGFTLIEMALVLVVLGLLLGGLLQPLSLQTDNSRRRLTKLRLQQVNEALIGYALVNGHLPCPDTDNDGRENRVQRHCAGDDPQKPVWHGTLPWLDLGIGAEDAWGMRYRYAVSATFTDNGAAPLPVFDLDSQGAIEVVNGLDRAPALVLSHGANTRGGLSVNGSRHAAPTGAFERENSDGDDRFHRAGFSNDPQETFDDQMIWISPYILKNRLLMAGRLKRNDR